VSYLQQLTQHQRLKFEARFSIFRQYLGLGGYLSYYMQGKIFYTAIAEF